MDDIQVVIAFMYAFIVAISYRKAGFMPALFWPVTIVIAGIMVYLTVILSPDPEDTPPN